MHYHTLLVQMEANPLPSWDCAANSNDETPQRSSGSLSSKENEDDGIAAFVADVGFWLEEHANMGTWLKDVQLGRKHRPRFVREILS
jgi:hypothetical protein